MILNMLLPRQVHGNFGYIVMLRARMFRSLIIRTGIKERNIRASDGRYWDSVLDIDIFPPIFSIRYQYSISFSGVTEYTEYELHCMLCHMIYAPTKHIHLLQSANKAILK